MNSGEITARHFGTAHPVRVEWANGVIESVERVADAPPNRWVAPALVDLQINGFAGVDFQQDNLTEAELLQAVEGLRRGGCTRFLLTLITDEWGRLMRRLGHLRQLRESNPDLRHAIAGWHIEGPFLSAEPGYCGAHNPALMIDPRAGHIRELREITGKEPVLLTVAPERESAMAAIELAVSLGLKLSLGHTNASAEQLREALKLGATGFTHLGNGCPPTLNRFDNILWRVFETPGLNVSFIPDRIHVSPALFRVAHQALGGNRIYYTSDAMSAAGGAPGRHRLGSLELEVGEDGIVRLPGSSNFAGSALTPIEGVFRAAEMLRCPWQETWARFSEAPAHFMGLATGAAVGQPADLCVLEVAEPNQLRKLDVI